MNIVANADFIFKCFALRFSNILRARIGGPISEITGQSSRITGEGPQVFLDINGLESWEFFEEHLASLAKKSRLAAKHTWQRLSNFTIAVNSC